MKPAEIAKKCDGVNDLARQIARTALEHYDTVWPSKGKPKDETEWTVYAAIVASVVATSVTATKSEENEMHPNITRRKCCWVVSSATGTKCTAVNTSNAQPWIVRDSHAEVLARRGLVHVLWREIQQFKHQKQPKQQQQNEKESQPQSSFSTMLLEPLPCSKEEDGNRNCGNDDQQQHQQFQLRPGLQLHLYVSDSPCGDASIYALDAPAAPLSQTPKSNSSSNSNNNNSAPVMQKQTQQQYHQRKQFTGAKIIVVSDRATHASLAHAATTAATAGGAGHGCNALQQHVPLELLHQHNSNNNGAGTDKVNGTATAATKIVTAREVKDQLLGMLRTKAGRSNLPSHLISNSMSCSDKLVKWAVLGLQGSVLLSQFIPEPIRLHHIVVSRDPRASTSNNTSGDSGTSCRMDGNATTTSNGSCAQLQALQRAIPDRARAVLQTLQQKQKTPTATKSTASQTQNNNQNGDIDIDEFALSMHDNVAIPIVSVVDSVFSSGKAMAMMVNVAAAAAATTATKTTMTTTMMLDAPAAVQKEKLRRKGIGTSTTATSSLQWHHRRSDANDNRSSQPRAKRQKRKTNAAATTTPKICSPCGFSVNWQQGQQRSQPCFLLPGNGLSTTSTNMQQTAKKRKKVVVDDDMDNGVEVTVGIRGIRQGKKPKCSEDYRRLRSRLCRGFFLELAHDCGCCPNSQQQLRQQRPEHEQHGQPGQKSPAPNHTVIIPSSSLSYRQWKKQYCNKDYLRVRNHVLLKEGPLVGWLIGQDDFGLSSVIGNDQVDKSKANTIE